MEPIFWRASRNKTFPKTFEGHYEGHWINSDFIEKTLEFNNRLEELCKIGVDKLKEVEVETLKYFFNLHVSKEFEELGRIETKTEQFINANFLRKTPLTTSLRDRFYARGA